MFFPFCFVKSSFKVILTERENAEVWAKSWRTWMQDMERIKHFKPAPWDFISYW